MQSISLCVLLSCFCFAIVAADPSEYVLGRGTVLSAELSACYESRRYADNDQVELQTQLDACLNAYNTAKHELKETNKANRILQQQLDKCYSEFQTLCAAKQTGKRKRGEDDFSHPDLYISDYPTALKKCYEGLNKTKADNANLLNLYTELNCGGGASVIADGVAYLQLQVRIAQDYNNALQQMLSDCKSRYADLQSAKRFDSPLDCTGVLTPF